MSLSGGISALCEEILWGKNLRAQSIGQIKGETKKLKEETKNMMATLHREMTKMAKEGHEERGRSKRLLVKETNDLLKRCKRERGEIRRNHMKMRGELLEAFGIWRSTFGSKAGVSTPKISQEEKVEALPREVSPRKIEPTAQERLIQSISLAKSLTDKILTVLREYEDGLTLEEASKVLDISEERLDRVIKRSIKRGDIQKVGERYRVVSS
jgi:hypothetical protein